MNMQKLNLADVRWPRPQTVQRLIIQKMPWKTLAKLAAVALLVQFGDVLLPLIGEGLHVALESVESGLERVLESVFGLSPRKAQAVLAYSAFVLVIYLTVVVTRKIHAAFRRLSATAQARWQAFKLDWRNGKYWRPLAVAVGVIGLALYLFI